MSRHVGSLAREKQCVLQRPSQFFLRSVSADFGVTVSASRKWIALPIVEVGSFEIVLQVLDGDAEQALQGLQASRYNKLTALP